ncbi:flagella-associated protein [Acetoanaerobium sticklandii]|uniref:Flagellar biosynthesis protein FlhF n=1 Tax=Acetoanaerobium sticklandii (strain ATCC 12662 / DSM 519 / JCM 1433 / CCUG 9281 / NCIMB 10654 / HF) TaxID=499177 RepID=E3PSI4_ACESD|nr:flagellar biosynthesis protein FlhF [Acetoanaerobium sticklandii]CBH21838.1 flagella-associated protein [Acetoanaerobium sticklandii]
MQIKKFVGENVTQTMALVKKEMGNDAIILQTKKTKSKGFLGFFKKDMVEVLAAIEPDKASSKVTKTKSTETSPPRFESANTSIENIKIPTYIDGKNDKNDVSFKEVNKIYQKPMQVNKVSSNADITKDIDEIKTVIKDLNERFVQTFKTEEDEVIHELKTKHSNKLVEKGISSLLSEEIVNEALSKYNDCNRDSIFKVINERFNNFSENNMKFLKKYNVFVGPTGVGKTTTLAKIASNLAIEEGKRIGFMTLDTYRISAVEQLRTYAEILNCPIEVAYDKADVSEAVKRLESRDSIFIDTAGRSHRNKVHMIELEEIIESIDEKEVFLVLSANFNKEDIKDILEAYSFIDDFSIVITKMDETSREGLVFDIINAANKPVSYITYGQNVPDDIEIFDFNKFVNEFLREI